MVFNDTGNPVNTTQIVLLFYFELLNLRMEKIEMIIQPGAETRFTLL